MATPTSTRVLPLVAALAGHGDRPALLTGEWALSYAELADRVEQVAQRLGPARRLVLLPGANDVGTLVDYLGALAAGCVVLLVPPGDRVSTWTKAYDPDVVGTGDGLLERRAHTTHDLHPDLALLLTTSGSTGSPKLVRLSYDNLQANAESVVAALGVRPDDRALTTLPPHYSYGLSVLHSHLLRGAAVVVTALSVADACFWDLLERTGATSFAGVPYTFELLDRVGFAERDLPSLRTVTCAGGHLAPDRVVRWTQAGRRRGWDLVVMYGQTEATARMAVLPPSIALEHPDAVGYAVPGGSFGVEPVDGVSGPVGEVVYTGPNVMLGYAESPADLGLGCAVEVLRTGDLGRLDDDGLLHVVGRRSRVAKVLGLRVDLGYVEAELARSGTAAVLAEDDGALVAAAAGRGDDAALRQQVAGLCGLPPRAVRAAHVGVLPRTCTGKPDAAAVPALVPAGPDPRLQGPRLQAPRLQGPRLQGDLLALYADVLERDDLTEDDSFVSAGGDSLSYVELSLRLEDALGHLPVGWHTTPVRDLRPCVGATRRTLETSVALRALAIVLVVAFHSNALSLVGGAHVLLGVAGFNLARFGLAAVPRRERLRHLGSSAVRIAVPTVVVAGAVALATGQYDLATVLQLNAVLGPQDWGPQWQLWFVEALLQLLAVVALLVAVPGLDRAERRWPFAAALVVVGAGLLVRYGVLPLERGPDGIHTGAAVLWLFGLGWAAARAGDAPRRALVSAVLLLALPGYFAGDGQRALVVAVGLLALIWVPAVPCPAVLRRLAGVLASSSLYVYLTHWQVYPHLESDHPWLGVLASLSVGIATWRAVRWVTARARSYVSSTTTEAASTQRRKREPSRSKTTWTRGPLRPRTCPGQDCPSTSTITTSSASGGR